MPNSNQYVHKTIHEKLLGRFFKSTVSFLCQIDTIFLFKNPQFKPETLYNWLWLCWY